MGLVGGVGSEIFAPTGVVNTQVESGRSPLITSNHANGKACLTPGRC
ncbi:MAG: hypothetical protein GX616_00490 [Planctomycetes bacterium]|nr:hypothetical protein [Planctomycetota bacterium]